MTPQYQFNLGQADPLLSIAQNNPEGYISVIIRLYSEWFRNINKNELDNKIIESAITFYFKDEDSGSTKTWNYFKTAN